MTWIYGLPAVEVEQPDGEVVVYIVRQVVPEGGECRAYVLTKPDGDENRVGDHGAGHWRCTCKAFVYRDRFDAEKQGRCKHCRAMVEQLEPTHTEAVEVA